jgi:hypothetical protein
LSGGVPVAFTLKVTLAPFVTVDLATGM